MDVTDSNKIIHHFTQRTFFSVREMQYCFLQRSLFTLLLGDHSISESERAEAAGVLAQVTSPWIEDNDYVLGVTENAFNLVKNLTSLCSTTKCDETFLLGSAALANLSFLSPLILTAMSQQR